jgi:hypothetical protein
MLKIDLFLHFLTGKGAFFKSNMSMFYIFQHENDKKRKNAHLPAKKFKKKFVFTFFLASKVAFFIFHNMKMIKKKKCPLASQKKCKNKSSYK